MKSNYERKSFTIKYWLIAVSFLICSVLGMYFVMGQMKGIIMVMLGMEIVFSVTVYMITYHYIHNAYKEIENVSRLMVEVTEHKEYFPDEEYKEGTIGILYTNYFKMVKALTDSRNRELQEKIFLRDIISDISHQLRTPLSSLNVFMDLLYEDKISDTEKKKTILKEASNQLNRMEWMVLSMLKLARIEAGAIQFDKKEIPLLPLLQKAKEGIQYLVSKREQNVSIRCPEQIKVFCDGDWLVEAIINLLKNASDYSGEGKTITIEAEDTKVYTRLYIKDEGVGIPEDKLGDIFKRFYRVNQEVNPNSVGIGLSLTKSIVEGMEGTIRVQSKEGQYTWFIITFMK